MCITKIYNWIRIYQISLFWIKLLITLQITKFPFVNNYHTKSSVNIFKLFHNEVTKKTQIYFQLERNCIIKPLTRKTYDVSFSSSLVDPDGWLWISLATVDWAGFSLTKCSWFWIHSNVREILASLNNFFMYFVEGI